MKKLSLVLFCLVLWSCGDQKPAAPNNNNPESPSNLDGSTGGDTTPGLDPSLTDGPLISTGSLKYPLILHHGFMDGTKFGSFGDMAKVFSSQGIKVFATEVSPANSIAVRGGQLAKQIQEILAKTGAQKVNIIGHSMAGLDARYVISHLNMSGQVASLTTLSTPHRGTKIADGASVVSMFYSKNMLDLMVGMFGRVTNASAKNLPTDVKAAIHDLSVKYLTTEFNPSTPDKAGVYYQSYAAKTCLFQGMSCKDKINPFFKMGFLALKASGGDNDGVVTVESAKWGNFRGVLDADHIDLTGRAVPLLGLGSPALDYKKFLQDLVNDLAQRGY